MAIREDADNESNQGLTRQEAESAFLEKWEVDADDQPSAPSKGAKGKAADETADEPDDVEELIEEDDEDQDDTEADDDDESETIAGDTAKVEIVVDGKKVTASVKELKRLYGQEQALTRKSQEVAEKRKEADAQHNTNLTAMKALLERANKRYEPYAGIDFLAASKQLDVEEFTALRTAALAAYEDVKFLNGELDKATNDAEAAKRADYQTRAKACVEALTHPETGLKGWNEDLYKSIGNFAIAQGMKAEDYLQITDPSLIKLLHQAMRYDAAKKVTLKRKAETPKVIKGKKPSDGKKFVRGESDAAMSKLRQSGSRQDAADAFLARWRDGSDD